MIIRSLRLLAATFLLAAFAVQARADDTPPDAVSVIVELQAGIHRIGTELTNADFAARYQAFAPLIDQTHDLPFMARFTASRAWNEFTDEQRLEFNALFRELSIATYAGQFREMQENTFSLISWRPTARERFEVQTRLSLAQGDPVALNYLLQERDSGWQIINVLAEGVSELAIKRSQYQQVLKSGGYPQLIAHLRTQIEAQAVN